MATRSDIPDEPNHFDDFGSAVMYLCEEAERIGLVRTRATLQHAYAQLPSEIFFQIVRDTSRIVQGGLEPGLGV